MPKRPAPLTPRSRTSVPPLDPMRYAPTAARPLRGKARRMAHHMDVQPHWHSWAQLVFSMSGAVQGYSLGLGLGGYAGHSSGSYSGSSSSDSSGMAYQASNLYPDSWNGATHPSGNQTGHIDFDNEAQGAVQNPNRPGVGGFAFDTSSHSSGSESGTTRGTESGGLGFVELSANDLYADLSGTVTTTRWVVVDATNTAGLSGNAFQNASGNIGINVASGSGNQQANSLAMAVAQPGAGGTGGGE